MAQGEYPQVQRLEERQAQIRERLSRRRGRGGWVGLLGGLTLGALAGGALAYLLRSREEEPLYSPPPATTRRDDAITLQTAPAPASAPAAADDDEPIVLKTPAPAAAATPADAGSAAEETSGWVATTDAGESAPTAEHELMPAAAATTEAAELTASPAAGGGADDEPAATEQDGPLPQYAGSVAPDDNQCPASHPIKGNRSRNNELIFHTPGSNNYDRTNPEACFATEEEAEAAGFRKARS